MDSIFFEDFPKICRLCLDFGTLQPIRKIKDLKTLNSITSINIKEGDKLPENICDKCVRQLADISSFISNCENNNQTLRKIILKEYENNIIDQTDSCDNDNGNESFDDQKDLKHKQETPNDSFCVFIKQEFILEPDFDADNDKKVNAAVSCENCSENFPDQESLQDHYKEIKMCRPRDFDVKTSVTNIIDYLKVNKNEKKSSKNKEKSEEREPEFVKGRELKGKRRFLCCYCGKNYTRKNGLDRHILSHTGVKPFECKECGKRYITKDTLKTHLLTHTGVKSHKCTICQKMFTQSSHLSYHMRRHSGEKPYSCAFCGKGFLSNYHLERHKLMHTGVKPFQCNHCGKQFVRGTTLRDHLLIHTGEKPFQCHNCGKQFNRKQSLTNHVLVHTGEVKHSGGGIARLRSIELVQNNSSDSARPNNRNLSLQSSTSLSSSDSNTRALQGFNLNNSDIMPIGTSVMYNESNPNNGY